jgi:hypothetical protein
MGMTPEDVNTEFEEVAPAKYKASSVPKPHSAFETYVLKMTPKHGLCWIKAIGPTIPTSVFGIELRSAFDSMEAKLTANYGKSERTDFLMSGSIWGDPQDWMQSFVSRERFLMTEWSPKHGSSLRDSLVSIALVVGVLDTTSGYIAVEYSFENLQAADAELAAAEDDVL